LQTQDLETKKIDFCRNWGYSGGTLEGIKLRNCDLTSIIRIRRL